jgi:hypothetical protein
MMKNFSFGTTRILWQFSLKNKILLRQNEKGFPRREKNEGNCERGGERFPLFEVFSLIGGFQAIEEL